MADSGPEEFYFLGVSTAGSSIVAVFPRWAEILGLDAVLVGRDLPLKSEPGAYDRLVRQIRDRPQARGGLVTSHKVAVYRHAGHLFQELDRWAELCGEVSCISKPDGRLVGQAKDPLTSGRALEDAVGSRYWLEHPEAGVLCLGAGGSGTAITCRLLIEDPPPARILLTNRSPERLEEVRAIHQRLGLSTRLEYHAVRRPEDSDALLARLPPESLVINATGMGKDAPGSPLSDAALFPRRAVVWDFNYRGELRFLEQAGRQAESRELSIHDGWRYFLHGWVEHISEVFQLRITADQFQGLAQEAEALRQAA